MTQISAFRSGNSVMVRFNGTTRTLSHQNEEESKETFRQIMAVKSDPTEENLARLHELVDPFYKISVNEKLEKDRSGNYYLAGVRTPLPRLLLEKVQEYIEEGFDLTPLINFWKLLVLNPDTHVRNSLYDFASHFGFPITNMGYFIAYKSVYFAGKKHENMALTISSRYVYLKAEGKKPADYDVYVVNAGARADYYVINREETEKFLKGFEIETEEEVSIRELLAMTQEERDALDYDQEYDLYYRKKMVQVGTPVLKGNLEELFRNLPAMFDQEGDGSFTDIHSRSMDIRLGTPVQMDRKDCDNNPQVTCSHGLHVGTPQYVKDFGSGNSRYIIACLVNPMNVVAVPTDYSGQKMRTCEYLPYAVCDINEDGTLKEIDTKFFEEDYLGYEVKELEKMLAELQGDPDADEYQVQQVRNRLIEIS